MDARKRKDSMAMVSFDGCGCQRSDGTIVPSMASTHEVILKNTRSRPNSRIFLHNLSNKAQNMELRIKEPTFSTGGQSYFSKQEGESIYQRKQCHKSPAGSLSTRVPRRPLPEQMK